MTEIPEHLLRRSRERRQAMGLGGDAPEETGSTPAEATPASPATPATTAAPTPAPRAAAAAPAEPPAPRPPVRLPAFIVAAKTRKRIPFWAVPVLLILPLWAFLWSNSLSEPTLTVTGPLAEGATVYSANCSSCHGATGGGGVGLPLSGGSVLQTFPEMADQIAFVHSGSEPFIGKPYGNPDRPGGQRIGAAGMPTWQGVLTDEQILAAVCYERVTLSGETPTPPACLGQEEVTTTTAANSASGSGSTGGATGGSTGEATGGATGGSAGGGGSEDLNSGTLGTGGGLTRSGG